MSPQTDRVIVCATDLSETARDALDEALELAERRGSGQLYALHIRETAERIESVAGALEHATEHEQDLIRLVEQEIARVAEARGAPLKVDVVPAVRHGKAYREILRFVLDVNADVLVIGTHGRTGLGHALLGSVAERVARKAPCDVVMAKAPAVRAHLAKVLRSGLGR
jgi:universal stress protein A